MCEVSWEGGMPDAAPDHQGGGDAGCCTGPEGQRGCSSHQASACLLAFDLLGNGEDHGIMPGLAPGCGRIARLSIGSCERGHDVMVHPHYLCDDIPFLLNQNRVINETHWQSTCFSLFTQTQVRWLEGMLTVLFLALAAAAGEKMQSGSSLC